MGRRPKDRKKVGKFLPPFEVYKHVDFNRFGAVCAEIQEQMQKLPKRLRQDAGISYKQATAPGDASPPFGWTDFTANRVIAAFTTYQGVLLGEENLKKNYGGTINPRHFQVVRNNMSHECAYRVVDLVAATGMRLNEAIALTVDSTLFNGAGGLKGVHWLQVGARSRPILMGELMTYPTMYQDIRTRQRQGADHYLFALRSGRKAPPSRRALELILTNAGAQFGFQDLQDSLGVHLLRFAIAPEVVQQILGYQTIAPVERLVGMTGK